MLTATRAARSATEKAAAAQLRRPGETVRGTVLDHPGTLYLSEHGGRGIKPGVMVMTEGERATGRLGGGTLAGFEGIGVFIDPEEPLRGQALVVERARGRLRRWLGSGGA
jgi:hypothetical protein